MLATTIERATLVNFGYNVIRQGIPAVSLQEGRAIGNMNIAVNGLQAPATSIKDTKYSTANINIFIYIIVITKTPWHI